MREIKFRAWDTIGKQWLRITGFETAETDVSKGYTIFGKGAGLFHDGDYVGSEGIILLQYTGLKDKNGKEIYEGDIVRFHYKTGVYKIGTVVWNDLFGSWDIDCQDFVSYKSLGQYKSVSEVIGNIYENPELLEGTV